MTHTHWSTLPCVYIDALSSATMISSQLPFAIATTEEYAERPAALHWHDSFEIGYVLAGSGFFVIEGCELPFQPGQIHVIGNTYSHMAYACDTAHFFNIHFPPDLLYNGSFPALDSAAQLPFTAGMARLAPLLPPSNPHTAAVMSLLQAIEAEHRAAAPHYELVIKGLLLQIIGLLLRHFLCPGPPDDTVLRRQQQLMRLRPALHLLERRLVDGCSVAQLAAAVTLSPSRFCALFHEAVGSSPVAYRNTRRILLAQRTLASTGEPIAAVAERCGFATTQQFNRIFRRVTGTTPGGYRARVQQ